MFTVYGSSQCKYCVLAVEKLDKADMSYKYYDIKDEANKDKLEFVKSRGFTTIPQIYFKEYHIGGYEDLLAYLKENTHV